MVNSYRIRLFVRVPMRDGVQLSAVLVLPEGPGPHPTIFRLTPYIADTFLPDGAVFAERGYAFLCADTRGRGESEGGHYRPLVPDGEDGFDAIAWIASQPWSNGDVVLYGSSYSGTNQWNIAATAPPALRAITPTGVSLLGHDYPFPGGIVPAGIFQILTLTGGRVLHGNALADTAQWNRMLAEICKRHARLSALSDLSGNPAPIFHEMRATAEGLAPFPGCIMDDADYAAIRVPVFSSTGTADLTCPGTLEAHRRFLAVTSEGLVARSRLVLGPWEHLGLETGSVAPGLAVPGTTARLDMRQLRLDWIDWILGRGPEPRQLSAPLLAYCAGDEQWIAAASIEALTDCTHQVWLAERTIAAQSPAQYRRVTPPLALVCDPDDLSSIALELELRTVPTPTKDNAPTIRIGPTCNDLTTWVIGADPTNDSFTSGMGHAGLCWTGEPLAAALGLAGFAVLDLWLRLDGPDADLALVLGAILPGGQHLVLAGEVMRLRDRHGVGREDVLDPGVPVLLQRRLPRPVVRTLPEGSRLQLVVRSGASIRTEKNLNTTTPVREQISSEARAVRVEVLCDAQHPSGIRLPLARHARLPYSPGDAIIPAAR